MDKEKIITIAIGLLVGGVLAGIYFLSGKFLPGKPKQEVFTPKKQVVSTPSAIPTSILLSIDKPDDGSTTTEDIIGVAGKTTPGGKVIIFSNDDEKVASAGADGKFMADISLEDGANTITITTANSDGKFQTIKRDVVLEVKQ